LAELAGGKFIEDLLKAAGPLPKDPPLIKKPLAEVEEARRNICLEALDVWSDATKPNDRKADILLKKAAARVAASEIERVGNNQSALSGEHVSANSPQDWLKYLQAAVAHERSAACVLRAAFADGQLFALAQLLAQGLEPTQRDAASILALHSAPSVGSSSSASSSNGPASGASNALPRAVITALVGTFGGDVRSVAADAVCVAFEKMAVAPRKVPGKKDSAKPEARAELQKDPTKQDRKVVVASAIELALAVFAGIHKALEKELSGATVALRQFVAVILESDAGEGGRQPVAIEDSSDDEEDGGDGAPVEPPTPTATKALTGRQSIAFKCVQEVILPKSGIRIRKGKVHQGWLKHVLPLMLHLVTDENATNPDLGEAFVNELKEDRAARKIWPAALALVREFAKHEKAEEIKNFTDMNFIRRQAMRDFRRLSLEKPSWSSPLPPELPTQDSAEYLLEIFNMCDKNNDGKINKRELIKVCRQDPKVAEFFVLSTHIRQEDGSRDSMEKLFQEIDSDGDRELSWEEFHDYYKSRKEQRTAPDHRGEVAALLAEEDEDDESPQLRNAGGATSSAAAQRVIGGRCGESVENASRNYGAADPHFASPDVDFLKNIYSEASAFNKRKLVTRESFFQLLRASSEFEQCFNLPDDFYDYEDDDDLNLGEDHVSLQDFIEHFLDRPIVQLAGIFFLHPPSEESPHLDESCCFVNEGNVAARPAGGNYGADIQKSAPSAQEVRDALPHDPVNKVAMTPDEKPLAQHGERFDGKPLIDRRDGPAVTHAQNMQPVACVEHPVSSSAVVMPASLPVGSTTVGGSFMIVQDPVATPKPTNSAAAQQPQAVGAALDHAQQSWNMEPVTYSYGQSNVALMSPASLHEKAMENRSGAQHGIARGVTTASGPAPVASAQLSQTPSHPNQAARNSATGVEASFAKEKAPPTHEQEQLTLQVKSDVFCSWRVSSEDARQNRLLHIPVKSNVFHEWNQRARHSRLLERPLKSHVFHGWRKQTKQSCTEQTIEIDKPSRYDRIDPICHANVNLDAAVGKGVDQLLRKETPLDAQRDLARGCAGKSLEAAERTPTSCVSEHSHASRSCNDWSTAGSSPLAMIPPLGGRTQALPSGLPPLDLSVVEGHRGSGSDLEPCVAQTEPLMNDETFLGPNERNVLQPRVEQSGQTVPPLDIATKSQLQWLCEEVRMLRERTTSLEDENSQLHEHISSLTSPMPPIQGFEVPEMRDPRQVAMGVGGVAAGPGQMIGSVPCGLPMFGPSRDFHCCDELRPEMYQSAGGNWPSEAVPEAEATQQIQPPQPPGLFGGPLVNISFGSQGDAAASFQQSQQRMQQQRVPHSAYWPAANQVPYPLQGRTASEQQFDWERLQEHGIPPSMSMPHIQPRSVFAGMAAPIPQLAPVFQQPAPAHAVIPPYPGLAQHPASSAAQYVPFGLSAPSAPPPSVLSQPWQTLPGPVAPPPMNEAANDIAREVQSLACELRSAGRVFTSELRSTSSMFHDMQRALLRRASGPGRPSATALEDPPWTPVLPSSAGALDRGGLPLPTAPPVEPIWAMPGQEGDAFLGDVAAPDLGVYRRSTSLSRSRPAQVGDSAAAGGRYSGTGLDVGRGLHFDFEPLSDLGGLHTAGGVETGRGRGGFSVTGAESGHCSGGLTMPLPRSLALGRGVVTGRGATRAGRRAAQPSQGCSSQPSRALTIERQLGALDDRLGKLDERFRRFATTVEAPGTGPSAGI
jgi:hypothetical protein